MQAHYFTSYWNPQPRFNNKGISESYQITEYETGHIGGLDMIVKENSRELLCPVSSPRPSLNVSPSCPQPTLIAWLNGTELPRLEYNSPPSSAPQQPRTVLLLKVGRAASTANWPSFSFGHSVLFSSMGTMFDCVCVCICVCGFIFVLKWIIKSVKMLILSENRRSFT